MVTTTTRGGSGRPTIARVAASPSSPGHPDVHEHDVRAQAACHLHGVHTGGGVADDLDVVLDAQHQPEARSDDRHRPPASTGGAVRVTSAFPLLRGSGAASATAGRG